MGQMRKWGRGGNEYSLTVFVTCKEWCGVVHSGTCMVVCGANKRLVRQVWADLGGNNDILN